MIFLKLTELRRNLPVGQKLKSISLITFSVRSFHHKLKMWRDVDLNSDKKVTYKVDK